MNYVSRILVILVTTTAILFSNLAKADWQLDNLASQLNFISTKNEHISEIHSFTNLSGNLSDAGELTVRVDLSSVDTNIPIRDERMKEHLFTLAKHPVATLTAKVNKDVLSLSNGQSLTVVIPSEITIAGVTVAQDVLVSVSKNNEGGLTATTVKPLLIQVATFNLSNGISKLKELAGLASISMTVPVTFSVKFERE